MINDFLFAIDLFIAEYQRIRSIATNELFFPSWNNINLEELNNLLNDMYIKGMKMYESGVLDLITNSQKITLELALKTIVIYTQDIENRDTERFIQYLQQRRNMCSVAFANQKQD